MAIIKDGNGGTQQLSIDLASTAARVTLYDTAGNPIPNTTSTSVPIALSALSATVSIGLLNFNGVAAVITNIGTVGNVLTPEISCDGGTTWVPAPTAFNATGISLSTIAAAGTYTIQYIDGTTNVRLRVSTYVSGTVTGTLTGSQSNSSQITINSYTVADSVLNSSNANLNSGATFTGGSDEVLTAFTSSITLFADQNCTVQAQQSPDGTNWDIIDYWYYGANSMDGQRDFQTVSEYFRVLVTNTGGSATTVFRLNTLYSPTPALAPRTLTQLGNNRVEVPEVATYMATAVGITPVATLTFSIKGSATKTVRVTRMGFSLTNTTTAQVDVSIVKYSAVSGGTPVTVTSVPLDSLSGGATALVQNWTTTPVTQTSVGTLNAARYEANKVGDNNAIVQYIVEFGNSQRGTSAVYLRGVAQWLGIVLSAAANTPVADCWVEFQEL